MLVGTAQTWKPEEKSVSMSVEWVDVCVTIIIVRQLHVEAHAVGQGTQVLHQSVKLPHQQHAGLLGVATGHGHLVAVDAERKETGGQMVHPLVAQVRFWSLNIRFMLNKNRWKLF